MYPYRPCNSNSRMSGAGQRSALELDAPLLCPVVVDGFRGHGDVELTVTGHRGRCGIKQTKTIATGLFEVKPAVCGCCLVTLPLTMNETLC